MKSIKNLIVSILLSVSILFTGWIAVSLVDIVADNTSRNPKHASWNFFVQIADYYAEKYN